MSATERGSSPAQQWVTESQMVEHNFKILLDNIKAFKRPNGGLKITEFQRLRNQLAYSMLLCTTGIIATGTRYVVLDQATSPLHIMLGNLRSLEKEIQDTGNTGQPVHMILDQTDFDSPSPLIIYLKMALCSGAIELNLDAIQHTLRELGNGGANNRAFFRKDFAGPRKSVYRPGMPACIMALIMPRPNPQPHEAQSDFIISATKDRYEHSWPSKTSKDIWQHQQNKLEASVTGENRALIDDLKTVSKNFHREFGSLLSS